MPILRVRDDEGNYVNIPAIKGEPGASGVIDGTTETTVSGILKGTGGHIAAAVAGTDYATPEQVNAKQNTITASGILKGNGSGGISAAAAGTDYIQPESGAWTPTASGNIAAVNTDTATYYKYGNFVYLYFSGGIEINGDSSNYSEIGGVPFAPAHSNGVGAMYKCNIGLIGTSSYVPTIYTAGTSATVGFIAWTNGMPSKVKFSKAVSGFIQIEFSVWYCIGE